MSAARVGGRYRSARAWHDVLVTRDPSGRWHVLDAAGSEIAVVETLTGHDDRLDQALALAATTPPSRRRTRTAAASPIRCPGL